MNILFIGDVIGSPGRKALATLLRKVREDYRIDLVVVNGENAAGGFGMTDDILRELEGLGCDGFTSGNHIWDKREILGWIDDVPNLIRPANYPEENPGAGSMVLEAKSGEKLGVINLMGRAFLPPTDCPFKSAAREVEAMMKKTPNILVDFHAETTSEKNAMGWYLDGRVSAVVGTHTHIQTADSRVLPGGTAYITDVGATAALDSVIGMEVAPVIDKFIHGRPCRFTPSNENLHLHGVVIDIDGKNGVARSIQRLSLPA